MTVVEREAPTTDAQINATLLDMAWRTARSPVSRPAPEALTGAQHRLQQTVDRLAAHRRTPIVVTPELVTRRDMERHPNVPVTQLAEVLAKHEHRRVELALEQRVADLQASILLMEVDMGLRQPPAPPAPPEPAPGWLLRR